MTVMDRIGGWSEGGRIEGGSQIERKLAANMGIYTEAVNCNGQNDVHGFGNLKGNSVFKAIDWVCA